MNILFGKLSQEQVEVLGVEGAFEHDGSLYEFNLELSEEQISLWDSCNRMVPIGVEDWRAFVRAVIIADTYYNAPLLDSLERIQSDEIRIA